MKIKRTVKVIQSRTYSTKKRWGGRPPPPRKTFDQCSRTTDGFPVRVARGRGFSVLPDVDEGAYCQQGYGDRTDDQICGFDSGSGRRIYRIL